MRREVERIAKRQIYAEVLAAYMEQPPFIADWPRMTPHPHVIVVPFFVADGLHSYQDIPVLLGVEALGIAALGGREWFRRNPYSLHGRHLYYSSAIGTEPLFAELILDQVKAFDDAFSKAPVAVSHSMQHRSEIPETRPEKEEQKAAPAELAQFGSVGQVSFGLRGDGAFLLTHLDDAEAAVDPARSESFERFTKPEDALEIAKYDDAGRFRPLRTEPNLRHGWRLDLRNEQELAFAIESFYPAMVGIWRAYENGALEPVPLRATLKRQSGMVAAVKQISDVTACKVIADRCSDERGCLKKIMWELEFGIPVPGLPGTKFEPAANSPTGPGNGMPMLCHEACNLLVSAMREEILRH